METEHPLRIWRKSKGFDLAKFAGMVGVAPSHISQIETGVKKPSLALAARIEAATDSEVKAVRFVAEGAAA